MTTTTKRAPRTQNERRQETIAQLIDSAISCLVEMGYTHTTTQAIAHKAGLSQGAIFRHFPTRQELLIAAADVLAERFLRDYRERLAKARPTPANELEVAVRVLSDVIASPNQIAWFELQLAARTDHGLCEAFRPIFLRCQRECIELGTALLPHLLGRIPMAAEVLQLLIHVFHGLTLDAHIEQNPAKHDQMLAVTTMVSKLLMDAIQPSPEAASATAIKKKAPGKTAVKAAQLRKPAKVPRKS
jgi:AcrR family transcriptional regulator